MHLRRLICKLYLENIFHCVQYHVIECPSSQYVPHLVFMCRQIVLYIHRTDLYTILLYNCV